MRTIIAVAASLIAVTIRPEIADLLTEFSSYVKVIALVFLLMDVVELVAKMRHG